MGRTVDDDDPDKPPQATVEKVQIVATSKRTGETHVIFAILN
jgi:hypothetical protein